MAPLVSVIIPVYNAENFLRETLESMIGQTYQNIEILCVDDGSTDSSPAILEEYKKKDGRIRVFRKENGLTAQPANTYISLIQMMLQIKICLKKPFPEPWKRMRILLRSTAILLWRMI